MIAFFRNGLVLLVVNVHYIDIIAGIVIIAAVALDCFIKWRKEVAWSIGTWVTFKKGANP
jgi:ribose/xylose/arabinose/galactoside ABC-type transport system permease subunit